MLPALVSFNLTSFLVNEIAKYEGGSSSVSTLKSGLSPDILLISLVKVVDIVTSHQLKQIRKERFYIYSINISCH